MKSPGRSLCGLVVVSLGVPVLLAAQTGEVRPQATTIDGAITHVYKSIAGAELRLHVFAPFNRASSQEPAILFFFGGARTGGSIEQFVPQSKHLAQRGMVAIVADYRVFGRHKTGPFEAIADAKSAIRWVRSRAKALRVDPNRIAAGGGSSGGHIALSSGVFEGFDERDENRSISSKPNLLILFNPAVDTVHESSPVQNERFGGRAREGSPLHHIHRGLPPTVIFHGKADTTVPYADVELFCSESTKLGNTCQLFGYEDATHGFFNPSREGGKWYRETLLEMDRFLTHFGYLSKPSTRP